MTNNSTTVFVAKSFITMDDALPRAEAVAVRGGEIVAVGTLDQVTAKLTEPFHIDYSLQHHVVMSGLIDQHLHPLLGATTLTTEVIAPEDWVLPETVHRAATTPEQYDERLRTAHRNLPNGEWLFSWGFHRLWHGVLTRARLDSLAGDRPVAVWQRSCHEWILNTAALNAIGFTRDKAMGTAYEYTQLDFDAGHFWENGWMKVLSPYLMPVFMTRTRFEIGLELLVSYLHMNGVTAINEPGIHWRLEPWDLYQQILGRDSTPVLSTFMVDGRNQVLKNLSPADTIANAQRQVERGRGTKVLVLDRHAKLFADGAIVSQMMQMKDPYLDDQGNPDPHHHGEWIMEPHELRRAFDTYWDAGWQLHIHVNGDHGLEVLTDIIEDAQRRTPRIDHRTVIVHFANSNEPLIDRLRAAGAIVSANPYYPVGFADKYAKHGLGPERADAMVRAQSVLRRGMHLSYHSDLPICASDPLRMAGWGVNRITASGRVAGPEQRIGVHDALRAVTIEAAYSWRMEDTLGSITVGKRANFTVLDQNPYEVDPSKLDTIRVLGTVYEGKWHPVPAAHVEQRMTSFAYRANGNVASQTNEPFSAECSEQCGCEVADFVAQHFGATGWAA
ncbi:MAG: amidohydrolase [Ilumatobacteraceae bacterium]